MTRKEFFEWLNMCPTHKWECTADEFDFIAVSFPVIEDEEEAEDEQSTSSRA